MVEYANSMSFEFPNNAPDSLTQMKREKSMSEQRAEHVHTDKQKVWESELGVFDGIEKLGMQKFVETIHGMDKAFHADKCLRCIDEGTTGGEHLAGSGILLSEEALIEAMKKGEIDRVTSHQNCGAAKEFLARITDGRIAPPPAWYTELDPSDQKDPEKVAFAFGEHQEKKFGVPHEHISAGDMERPSDMHIARAAYFDGTGSFDFSQVKDLPKGFGISRRILTSVDARKEVALSASIAMDKDHGLGDFITSEHPFYIIVVGDPDDPNYSVETLTAELEGVEAESEGRIKVIGFTKPMAEEELKEAA
jgi:hypothetical protein